MNRTTIQQYNSGLEGTVVEGGSFGPQSSGMELFAAPGESTGSPSVVAVSAVTVPELERVQKNMVQGLQDSSILELGILVIIRLNFALLRSHTTSKIRSCQREMCVKFSSREERGK